jgi:putative MATE family efflux protein
MYKKGTLPVYIMDVTTGSISDHIKKLAIPASIGFFFQVMYNVVDTIYAGQLSTTAIASLSLSFPVFFIIIALGIGISQGATVLISHALGAKQKDDAKRIASKAIGFSIIISFFLTLLGLALSPWLFTLLGASGDYLVMSVLYMNIICLGSFTFLVANAANASLSAQGNMKPLRNSMIAAFFLNIILNPWFMYGGFGLPAMGLAGIALATIVTQFLSMCYLLYVVSRSDLWPGLTWKAFRPNRATYWEITKQGFPASLNMLTVAVGIFILTYYISPFGQEAVAMYGISTRIEQIFLLPAIGLNIATLTIVGQNYGAKRFDRIKEAYELCLRYGFYVSLIGLVLLLIIPQIILRIFTQDAQVISLGIIYLRIAALMLYSYVVMFLTVALMQGLKRPMFGLYVGISRQVILPLLLIPLGIALLGLVGIWWSLFLIINGFALGMWLYARHVLVKLQEST